MTETTSSFRLPTQGSRKRTITSVPQTIAEWVERSLSDPRVCPLPPPKGKRKRPAGVWDQLKTPEERSEYAKWLASLRKPENMARPGSKPGAPNGWHHRAASVAKAEARLAAEQLVSRLKANGTISPDDKEGADATIEALTLVRAPGGCREKRLRTAKALLRHYHPDKTGSI